jgi:WD40 repeat protein
MDDSIEEWTDLIPGWTLDKNIFGHKDEIRVLFFHPDQLQLFSGSWDHQILQYSFQSEELRAPICRFLGHMDGITAITWNPTQNRLITGSKDGMVRVWNPNSGECVHLTSFGHGKIYSLCYESEQKHIFCGGSDGWIVEWDDQLQKLGEFKITSEAIHRIQAISQKNLLLFSGDDSNIFAWDQQIRKILWIFSGHQKRVFDIIIDSDEKHMISSGEDKTIRKWDLATGQCLQTQKMSKACTQLFLNADNYEIYTVSTKGHLFILDASTLAIKTTIQLPSSKTTVLAGSHDGNWLVLAPFGIGTYPILVYRKNKSYNS